MARLFKEGERFGAGVLPIRDGRFILQRRAAGEHEPLTWCCFGGMGEGRETPLRTARRELREESGIETSMTDLTLVDQRHQEADGFTFWTFVAPVGADDAVTLSSESHEHGEFEAGDTRETLWDNLPTPLHSGMADLVRKPDVADAVLAIVQRQRDMAEPARP